MSNGVRVRLSPDEARAVKDALAVAVAFWTVIGAREYAEYPDGLDRLIEDTTTARETVRRALADSEDA